MLFQIDRTKICLASLYTNDLSDLAAITLPNKEKYCKSKGYSYIVKKQDQAYTGFDKVLFLHQLAETKQYDWILWCDCDTLITNFNKNIEDLIDFNYHFFLTTDVNGINAGVFLFRTSLEGMSYLRHVKEKMYEYAPYNLFKFGEEQTAMIHTYQDQAFKSIVKILPQRSMNSYNYSLYNYTPQESLDKLGTSGIWQPEDFIIHIPGFGPDRYDQRLAHFKYYIEKVIQ